VPNTVEICQVAGAVFILVGFAGQQLGWLNDDSLPYLLFNIAGGGTLAVVASLGRDWGFLLLEGSWAAISLVSLVRRPFHHASRSVVGAHRAGVRSQPRIRQLPPAGGGHASTLASPAMATVVTASTHHTRRRDELSGPGRLIHMQASR
jgi:hypothetical protein